MTTTGGNLNFSFKGHVLPVERRIQDAVREERAALRLSAGQVRQAAHHVGGLVLHLQYEISRKGSELHQQSGST